MKGGSWFSNQLPLIQFTKRFPEWRYAYNLVIKEKKYLNVIYFSNIISYVERRCKMIRKAETTRCSVVLENDKLQVIDETAKKLNKTRSEVIRELINNSIDLAIWKTPTRDIWKNYIKNHN